MFQKTFWFLSFLFCSSVLGQTTYRNLSVENWTFNKQNEIVKHKANVPGTVHTDLVQNNLIPNPFFGTNEKQLQWIENENWEYNTSFFISKTEFNHQNIEIQFDGLDTYASVYLNGKLILEADNMFRKWQITAKPYLVKGNNNLKIIFKSAVAIGKAEVAKLSYTLPGDEKVFTRKAQYQYGWDWGPRFVTAGIWKDIQLKFWNNATIENIRYEQIKLTNEVAKLNFIANVNCAKTGDYSFRVNDILYNQYLIKGINQVKLPFEVKNPKRWWPNGLGEAFLYPFTIGLSQQKEQLDAKQLHVGLRTVELVQEKDAKGKSFYFKVNNVPVFMKGANYIPADNFIPRVTDSIYKSIVQNAKKANMNMLRVWGGGIYEKDIFYDECDKNGILVWQDFMFACAMYPGDDNFLDNVKQEVIDNVNRLQNHASIAIWCGNNENDEGWHNWGWQKQYNYSQKDSTQIWNDYKRVFHEIIPNALDSLVSKEKNIYWSSSPSIGWGKKESLLQGDSHYWGVWWGKEPFEIYEKKVGRFMSEYGFQGMPNIETFKKITFENDLNLTSEAIKNHQKHPVGFETIAEYMERDYIVPTKFEDYIYVSQLLQARGMKIAIEAHRRAKPYCMGTLYWQLNDCWPVTSWSSFDYYGNWKALHYQVKESYNNVLLSVVEEIGKYNVYVVNDDLKSYEGELKLELISFDGKTIWSTSKIKKSKANSSEILAEIPITDFSSFHLKQMVLKTTFTSENLSRTNHYFFVKPKELILKKPNIQFKKIDAHTIEVTTDVLAKNVFLSAEGIYFEANYFDLLPNERRVIKLSKNISEIKIKSLFDTLK